MFGGFDNSTNICDMMPTVEWSHQHVTDDDLIEPMITSRVRYLGFSNYVLSISDQLLV